LLIIFFGEVVFLQNASSERQLEDVVLRDNFNCFFDVHVRVLVFIVDTDADTDLFHHAWGDHAVFMLSDDDTFVLHRLDRNAVTLRVLIFDSHDDFS